MYIPKELKIGAIIWKVKEVPSAEIDCDSQVPADQSDMTQTIRLAKELSQEMKEVCLIHEILHCIDSELDHDLVDLLASSIYQVFKDNKFI